MSRTSILTPLRRIRFFKPRNMRLRPFHVMRFMGGALVPGYRFVWPQMAWWQNPGFNEFLARFGEQKGMNTDRRWVLYQLQRLTTSVAGDTAECGVFKGAGSYSILKVNEASTLERTHLVFDSFEGLSDPDTKDGDHWESGDLICGLETVKQALGDFDNVLYFKGWIPTRFEEVADRRFAYVHIDVDLFQPTLDSVAFFYDRLNPGGILVCDDYGFTNCPGATNAVDQFLEDKPEKMIELGGGGGFFIKGTETLATVF